MRPRKTILLLAAAAALTAAGCGENGGDEADARKRSSGPRVLPVKSNPIADESTAPGLRITQALVENNVDAKTGKDSPDHLEIALENTTGKSLDGIEVYYEIIDRKDGVSEGYHAKLDGFTIAPGATRVAHFDGTGAQDHFPVNEFSLYYTDEDQLVVEVMASAPGLKPATFSVTKDAASAEAGVEQD